MASNPLNYIKTIQPDADDFRLSASLFSLIAGEDIPSARMMVEFRNTLTNITVSAPNNLKATSGYLHNVVFNQPFANVFTIYDNTAASGTVLATISGGLAISAGTTFPFQGTFATGLTVSATGNPNVTISYR